MKADLKYPTLQGELVRSLSEKYIADFLFTHGMKYEYEHPLFLDGRSIRPDFYLPAYNTYIEFWGMLEEPEYFNSSGRWQNTTLIR